MIRFVGNPGQFIVGIPARDMAEDEARKYGGADALIASRLYIKMDTHGEPIVPIEEAALSGVIDLSDGVDDLEAKLAGQALQQRRVQHGKN